MNKKQPLVSIGIPTYNRPNELQKALKSITNQTYTNLEIIVSDNSSPGHEVDQLMDKVVHKDERIHYYKQSINIGALANFNFVLKKATGEYFLWAADDDFRDKEFIKKAIDSLQKHPETKAWFCTIQSTNMNGDLIREYDGFSRFTSSRYKWLDLAKYFWEPEILGKANLFYSVFETHALRKTLDECAISETWGSDMCFVFAFISRYNLLASDEVLMSKEMNDYQSDKMIVIKNPYLNIVPYPESLSYFYKYFKGAKKINHKLLIIILSFFKFGLVLRNQLHLIFNKIKSFFSLYLYR